MVRRSLAHHARSFQRGRDVAARGRRSPPRLARARGSDTLDGRVDSVASTYWPPGLPSAADLGRRLDRAAYQAQQWSLRVPLAALRALTLALSPHAREVGPDAESRRAFERRYQALLERDLANVEAGLYPRALLFQMPIATYAWRLPRLLADVPSVLERVWRRDWRALPADVDVARYPAYFRRTFHWQTDGYFSRRSAELYDVGVELLFAGTADVMRRQVIPPISRALACGELRPTARLLDLACGTGRTLAQIAIAHPGLRLTALDLSPYYLQEARATLADVPDVSFVAENAESLPFRDAHFDVVTCVYLFHELPRPARRRVLAEAFRVLAPGGLFVIEDSAQLAESGELAFFLGRFATEFHEPFYRDYLEDDLAGALAEAGFLVDAVEPHYVAKVFVARKPPKGPRA
jgi:ubiquinone/menaquinone biosynthesis C-methylase UbiE